MSLVAVLTLETDVERDAAGFDLLATAPGGDPIELPPQLAAGVGREAPTAGYTGPVTSTWLVGESVYLPIHSLSDDLLAEPPTGLQSREARYDTDAEVWEALATDPAAVAPLGLAGDEVTLRRPDGDAVTCGSPAPRSGPCQGFSWAMTPSPSCRPARRARRSCSIWPRGSILAGLMVEVDAPLLGAVVAVCYLAILSVTALPARRASRLVPVEAIRAD